jgi:hypothetical protein
VRALDTLTPEAWRGYQRDTFSAGSWVCEDGIFRTVAEADPMDLITRQQYRHCELTLAWRVTRGGKSGILSRVTEALPHAWQSGLDMPLLDDAHHPDGQTPETSAGAFYGPTEGKLRCNPVGCWRKVNIAVFPFRTGTCARKCPLRGPFFCRTTVRISGSGNVRKFVRGERIFKAL